MLAPPKQHQTGVLNSRIALRPVSTPSQTPSTLPAAARRTVPPLIGPLARHGLDIGALPAPSIRKYVLCTAWTLPSAPWMPATKQGKVRPV